MGPVSPGWSRTIHKVVLYCGPQHRASGAGSGTGQIVGNQHPIDHVGQHRDPGTTFDAHRNGDALGLTLQGAINPIETRWTAKTRDYEATSARHITKGAGGSGKTQRGGFHGRHTAKWV